MLQPAPHSPSAGTPENSSQKTSPGRIDDFICTHANLIALAIGGVGLLLRLHAASGTFLNPDEAMHVTVADQDSLADAYQASLSLAHPPLMVLVLYFWRHIGTSEFSLRLPSVVAGTLFYWLFFRWAKVVLGSIAAIVALMFASLLPPLVALSSEVRQYSLLLVFMAGATYLLEISILKNSVSRMAFSFLCLWLAVLSHYSGLPFAAAFCIYGGLRLRSPRKSGKLFLSWVAGLLGTAALFLFLYQTQISTLKASELAGQAANTWLRRSYFHSADENLMAFIFGRSFAVFQFIFGQQVIGDIAGVLFIFGILSLVRNKSFNLAAELARPLAAFLALPFMINCALAIGGHFPYGGTRHTIFLEMFALAGVAFFILSVTRARAVVAITIAAIVVIICYVFGFHHQPYMARTDQSRARMNEAMGFVRHDVPRLDLIFVDHQASLMLAHYLCDTKPKKVTTTEFDFFDCAGHHIIALAEVPRLWAFTPESFGGEWDDLVRTQQLKPGANVWVVQAGWGASIALDLPQVRPDLIPEQLRSFGRNISLFRLSPRPIA
jgi:4-amino-4-deoxy-L-arabinose transferase-like glycosyltransferase